MYMFSINPVAKRDLYEIKEYITKKLDGFGCRRELTLPILTLIGKHTYTLGLVLS